MYFTELEFQWVAMMFPVSIKLKGVSQRAAIPLLKE
jgi:hypothetical protein